MFVVIRLPRLYRVHIESEPYMISQDGLSCCFRYNKLLYEVLRVGVCTCNKCNM